MESVQALTRACRHYLPLKRSGSTVHSSFVLEAATVKSPDFLIVSTFDVDRREKKSRYCIWKKKHIKHQHVFNSPDSESLLLFVIY